MSFLRDFEKITIERDYEYFVFVKCGAFYISLSKEAIFLNSYLNLKLGYIGRVFKIAFPTNAVWKYIGILKQIGFSFKIYDYAKIGEVLVEDIGKNKYVVKYEYIGKSIPISKSFFGSGLYE